MKLLKIADGLDGLVDVVARLACWSTALLMAVIICNVILRYGFNNGLILFEEIQWHFYAIGIMFGLSYAERTNSQVRVDLVASRLKPQTRLYWEIFGTLVFVFPLVYVFVFNSLDYVANAYNLNERSSSPLGLPYRWAIKAVIPLSFSLLGIAALANLIRNISLLVNKEENHGH